MPVNVGQSFGLSAQVRDLRHILVDGDPPMPNPSYRIALDRIREAEENGATAIDLSDLGLTPPAARTGEPDPPAALEIARQPAHAGPAARPAGK